MTNRISTGAAGPQAHVHSSDQGESVTLVLDMLRKCAADLGRPFADLPPTKIAERIRGDDAALVVEGLRLGLWRIEGCNYVRTLDPHQGTAWLVEGHPARPCWEYIPHLAGYVELLNHRGVPASLVRFETPDAELRLDLVVCNANGKVVVLGEAKSERRGLDALLAKLLEFCHTDPGPPLSASLGGPSGTRREAWKLAHQLWRTRPLWLWLIGPGERRAFTVAFDDGMLVAPSDDLPALSDLDLGSAPLVTPTIRVVT